MPKKLREATGICQTWILAFCKDELSSHWVTLADSPCLIPPQPPSLGRTGVCHHVQADRDLNAASASEAAPSGSR